jgi:methyltransferase
MELIKAIVLIFTIIERIAELFVSRRNQQWSLARGGREFGQRHYPFMVAMHIAFLISMAIEGFFFSEGILSAFFWPLLVLIVLAQIVRWWVIITLGFQWNTRVIIVPGMKRVGAGPFRFFNHPNYIVVIVETIALPLFLGAWKTAIIFSILNAMLLRVRIQVENQALRELDNVAAKSI